MLHGYFSLFSRSGFGAGACIDDDAESSTHPAGVDWKALVIPALLPISTDYAPKKEDFEKDFFINEYSVISRSSNAETEEPRFKGPA